MPHFFIILLMNAVCVLLLSLAINGTKLVQSWQRSKQIAMVFASATVFRRYVWAFREILLADWPSFGRVLLAVPHVYKAI